MLLQSAESSGSNSVLNDPDVKRTFFNNVDPVNILKDIKIEEYDIKGRGFKDHKTKLCVIVTLIKVLQKALPNLVDSFDPSLFVKNLGYQKKVSSEMIKQINPKELFYKSFSDIDTDKISKSYETKENGFYVDINEGNFSSPGEIQFNITPLLKVYIIFDLALNVAIEHSKSGNSMRFLKDFNNFLPILNSKMYKEMNEKSKLISSVPKNKINEKQEAKK